MLISRVPDEAGGEGGDDGAAEEIAHNFQTASELFELMTKDHDFDAGDDALTTRDLVLLYKNIDLGKQLMSNVNELKRQTPNQYVEDVVYRDDAETDSDLSETYSGDDLHHVMLANKERIDLLTNKPSLNSLCHKLGDLEIQVSNISTDYDRHFLFKDPYIKEQLKSLQLMSQANELETAMLPTSLLDYICCKRLEDNYNFYMDNIIRYVKHTIEQLKRISNGDYLPDRVKEKWREVEHGTSGDNASKILTTSISIPLQVERKVTGLTTTWDDIVHSEVDLRSLVKILEKKIVLEVPKVICGSYKLFSNYRAENLVLSCKRKKRVSADREESRVDVVVQLQRSSTGQLLGNIDSIMVLQPQQQIVQKDCTKVLPLTYETEEQPIKLTTKVIELPEPELFSENKTIKSNELHFTSLDSFTDYRSGCYELKDSSSSNATKPGSPTSVAQILSTVSRVIRTEAAANHASPNELHFSMINLNRQTSLPEEGSVDSLDYTKTRKKSPTKVRIKSPYENKSAILEERKRRRLLEVRERRERRKMAMDENSKVSKHKALPQAVSSVTKLSITNKAFYNSIYGRNLDTAKRLSTTSFGKLKGRKEKQYKDGVIQEMEQESEGESVERDNPSSDKNMKKINKSHFLDDAETEMSYLQSKMDNGLLRISTSTSAVSNESATNLCTQSDYCPSLMSLDEKRQDSPTILEKRRSEPEVEVPKKQSELNKVPDNSPKCDSEKGIPAVECRRSLEKIYTLMKKLREIESNETTVKKKPLVSNEARGLLSSESGTSLNHRLSYSNPSCTSFEKPDDHDTNKEASKGYRPTTVVPKVVISTKPPAGMKTDETKKDRKGKIPRIRTIPENPLRAISQLLHEFDNVQKSRQKVADPKSINRSMSTDARNVGRPELQKRRSRIDAPSAKEDPLSKVTAKVKTRFISREEPRPEIPKTHILDKKNLNDLIDEVKEARGEAVKGPAKFSSRLNMLAQPKRAYVQALGEEFPRRQISEKPPRELAHSPRLRRRGGELHSSLVSVKPPHSLERAGQPRRSAGSSPDPRAREPPQFAALAAAAANTLRPTLKKKTFLGERPASGPGARGAQRAGAGPTRAPLLPGDLELLSHSSSPAKENTGSRATSIGSKLHHMVQSMLRAGRPAPPPPPPPPLAPPPRPRSAALPDRPSPDTCHPDDHRTDDRLGFPNAATPANSVTELEMLEHALHRRLSSGTFPGRLRIMKLTLTPKPSLQQIARHQSGDATSLIFESDGPKKITVTAKSTHLKTDLMALLSSTRMNCGVYGFPLQISTVGYAFPVLRAEMKKMNPMIVGKDLLKTADAETTYAVSERLSRATTVLEIEDEEETTCRYFVGRPRPAGAGRAVQVGRSDDLLAAATTTLAEQVCTPRKTVDTNATEGSTVISDSWDTIGTQDEESTIRAAEEKYELSDYTTSLDMLVGLLNEIQKITTSAGEAPSAETMEVDPPEPSPRGRAARRRLGELEADCFSLFASEANVSGDHRMQVVIPKTKSVGVGAEVVEGKPVCEDKQVWARVSAPQRHAVVNTEPPAPAAGRPGPPPHDAATSTINIPTSSCSISTVTFSEENDVTSDTPVKSDGKITEQTRTSRNSVKSLVPFYDNMFRVKKAKKRAMVPCDNMVQYTVCEINSTATCDVLVNEASVRTSKNSLSKCDDFKVQNNKQVVSRHYLNAGDWDSTLKMKRDVLVTLYSILVLTVFAALAFPELQFLQHA